MSSTPKFIKVKGQMYRLVEGSLDIPERYLERLNETIGLLRQASEKDLYAEFPQELRRSDLGSGHAREAMEKLMEALSLFRALRDKIESALGWAQRWGQ